MSKKERQAAIEAHISAAGKTTLPPGENIEFMAYQMEQKRRAFFGRKMGSNKASKSPWFKRGEGCI